MNYTTQYLTDPRKNRNSGAKVSNFIRDKIQTVEYQEIHTRKYQGKYYIVYYTILESVEGKLLKSESEWVLQD